MAIIGAESAADAFHRLETDPEVMVCVIPLNMNEDLARFKQAVLENKLDMRISDQSNHVKDVLSLSSSFNGASFLPVRFEECEYPGVTPMRLDLRSEMVLESRKGKRFKLSDAFALKDYGPIVTDFYIRGGHYDGGGNEMHRDYGDITVSIFAAGDTTVLDVPGVGLITPKGPCMIMYRGIDHPLVRAANDETLALRHRGQPNTDTECAAMIMSIGRRRLPEF